MSVIPIGAKCFGGTYRALFGGKNAEYRGSASAHHSSIGSELDESLANGTRRRATGKDGTLNVKNVLMNDQVFRQGYEKLAASTLQITDFSNTRIEGYIDCNRDGVLYTSIPQDGNWHAIVDGEEVEPTLVGDAMVAVPVTEGHHEITFVYRNGAFAWGWKISLGCLMVFGSLTYLAYFRKRLHYKGKYMNG